MNKSLQNLSLSKQLFILNEASNDFGKKSSSLVDTFCPEMSIVSLIKESCPKAESLIRILNKYL